MAEQNYQGRLELTWTNKAEALLPDEGGNYEWVSPSDYRVAEVRLFNDAEVVGQTDPKTKRAKDNLLIRGDSLLALTSLAGQPEFASRLLGQVKLAYADPPFNLKASRLNYDDALEHSVWLTMMRDRLVLLKQLLADDGSIWVHCDDSEQAYLKVLMDEVLGRNAWVATIVWQKKYSRENRKAIGTVHDYLLVYAPMGVDWKHVRHPLPPREAAYTNPDNDPLGPYETISLSAQAGHATPEQFYDIETPSKKVVGPPAGRAWSLTENKFWDLVAEGRVWWGKNGSSRPRRKIYEKDERKGLVPWTWWTREEVGDNEESKKEILALFPGLEPFETPKPERLMQRVIGIATGPGELVLDPFLGSGTTAAVAQKMGRRWVGIEHSTETIDSFALPRLKMVVEGKEPQAMRVTKSLDWEGGGGFRVLDVAPSMFATDRGIIVLADWATNHKLGEATAAQLQYKFEDDPPFVGRRGRTRLAVIDGLVSKDVVRLLVEALAEDEKLIVCGTAVSPDAGAELKMMRRGSVVRKIPSSILAEYRRVPAFIPRLGANQQPPGEPSEIVRPGLVGKGTQTYEAPTPTDTGAPTTPSSSIDGAGPDEEKTERSRPKAKASE
jgi:adenine-specific DNA-methyltransferase